MELNIDNFLVDKGRLILDCNEPNLRAAILELLEGSDDMQIELAWYKNRCNDLEKENEILAESIEDLEDKIYVIEEENTRLKEEFSENFKK